MNRECCTRWKCAPVVSWVVSPSSLSHKTCCCCSRRTSVTPVHTYERVSIQRLYKQSRHIHQGHLHGCMKAFNTLNRPLSVPYSCASSLSSVRVCAPRLQISPLHIKAFCFPRILHFIYSWKCTPLSRQQKVLLFCLFFSYPTQMKLFYSLSLSPSLESILRVTSQVHRWPFAAIHLNVMKDVSEWAHPPALKQRSLFSRWLTVHSRTHTASSLRWVMQVNNARTLDDQFRDSLLQCKWDGDVRGRQWTGANVISSKACNQMNDNVTRHYMWSALHWCIA